MSLIGYSQLMKDIFDLDKLSIERLLEKLSKHKPSELRLRVLKQLAKDKRETISGLLRRIKENNTGGTYKAIHLFFISLEKDGFLKSERMGRRFYWKFSENCKDLENYFANA